MASFASHLTTPNQVAHPTPINHATQRRRRLSNFHLPSATRRSGTFSAVRVRLPSLARESLIPEPQLTTPPISTARSSRHVTITSPPPRSQLSDTVLREKLQSRRSTNVSHLTVSTTPDTSGETNRCKEFTTPTRNSTRRSSHRAPLNRAQLSAMYASTIKLCQDNKINARNTWTLSLIDYMPMLVGPQSAMTPTRSNAHDGHMLVTDRTALESPSSDTDFQLAGATLDAGVRIYCSRVDSVHNNAYKVLGGLSQTGPGSADGSAEEVDHEDGTNDASGDDAVGIRKKHVNSGRPGRATLASNLQLITLNRLETDLMADPLFQNMSAAFDEGGAAGMLVHNLPLAPSGTIIFDSADTADILVPDCTPPTSNDSEHEILTDVVSIVDFPEPVNVSQDINGFGICPKFFRLMRAELRSAGKENTFPRTIEQSQSSVPPSSWAADESPSAAVSFQYDIDDLDRTEGLGVSQFDVEQVSDLNELDEKNDEDDVDVFSHDNTSTLKSHSEAVTLSAARRGTIDLIEAGLPLENGEYSFFASALTSMGWAGPTHWRYRPGLTGAAISKGIEKEKKRRPRGRTAQLLDFSTEAPDLDFAKLFAPGKSRDSNQLSHGVRVAMTKDKVTLPEDLHLSPRCLTELFLRPGTYVTLKDNERINEGSRVVEGTPTWQDFDRDVDQGADDSFDVSGGMNNDYGDAGGEESCQVQRDGDCHENESTRLSLVQEPQRVQALDIDYAKVAKRVDVRALKSGLWSRLCGEVEGVVPNEASGESGPEINEGINANKSGNLIGKQDVRRGDVIRLTEVVKDAQSFVPVEAQEDVSLAYVFICLLHLANERGLRVTQTCDGSQEEESSNGNGRVFDDLAITCDVASDSE